MAIARQSELTRAGGHGRSRPDCCVAGPHKSERIAFQRTAKPSQIKPTAQNVNSR